MTTMMKEVTSTPVAAEKYRPGAFGKSGGRTSWRSGKPSSTSTSTPPPPPPPSSPPSPPNPPVASNNWRSTASTPQSTPQSTPSTTPPSTGRTINWSAARSGAPPPQKLRGPASFNEVSPAQVWKLPASVPAGSVFHTSKMRQQPGANLEGHPVVVMGTNPIKGTVRFMIVTSFTEKTGSTGLPANLSAYSANAFLLCDGHHNVDEHSCEPKLTLVSAKFKKPSYINMRGNVFEIEWEHLESWVAEKGERLVFDTPSFNRILAGRQREERLGRIQGSAQPRYYCHK
ncbi:hypothetical protein P280DRAFT_484114 [Massarina eburnea CBS 473.64]|uniref:Uncharacterized protein n=1 Tax=Massarina eburnea CBS 473.64 TaxID=1395130 RepID=A0A6A6RKZ3_9PLEO|nr:hypothetical protein P280DRAFT_484114 [Massarina eburnea CBS 473.64]